MQEAIWMQRGREEGVKAVGMGERYFEWLLGGIRRLHEALGRLFNRQPPPPGAPRSETYTDQW